MSEIEELLKDDDGYDVTPVGDVEIDYKLNIFINPVNEDGKRYICNLKQLPEEEPDNTKIKSLKEQLLSLKSDEYLPRQGIHPDERRPSFLQQQLLPEQPVSLYKLDVDDEYRLVLPLENHEIPAYKLTDSDGLNCSKLRDYVDDEELYKMIEYTKESENDSNFYITEDFERIVVRTGTETQIKGETTYFAFYIITATITLISLFTLGFYGYSMKPITYILCLLHIYIGFSQRVENFFKTEYDVPKYESFRINNGLKQK